MSAWVMVVACLAGGAGAVARWLIDTAISPRVRTSFPLAIFCINVVGSFALGIVISLLGASDIAAIIGTGFLGGFTTFSTVSVASVVLAESGKRAIAGINIVGTFVACALAAYGGLALGTAIG